MPTCLAFRRKRHCRGRRGGCPRPQHACSMPCHLSPSFTSRRRAMFTNSPRHLGSSRVAIRLAMEQAPQTAWKFSQTRLSQRTAAPRSRRSWWFSLPSSRYSRSRAHASCATGMYPNLNPEVKRWRARESVEAAPSKFRRGSDRELCLYAYADVGTRPWSNITSCARWRISTSTTTTA